MCGTGAWRPGAGRPPSAPRSRSPGRWQVRPALDLGLPLAQGQPSRSTGQVKAQDDARDSRACPVLALGPKRVQPQLSTLRNPVLQEWGGGVGAALPTETRCPKVSSITSWYSVLCEGSSSPHSSLLKSTAMSRKVTGSCNITLCVCPAGGRRQAGWDTAVPGVPLLWGYA